MDNINILGISGVAFIVVMCILIGLLIKATSLDNKWIPIICGASGGLLGAFALWYGVPDFPAADYFNAVAIGIVSGLGSVGCHQVVKQLIEDGIDYKEGYYNLIDENERLYELYADQINNESCDIEGAIREE